MVDPVGPLHGSLAEAPKQNPPKYPAGSKKAKKALLSLLCAAFMITVITQHTCKYFSFSNSCIFLNFDVPTLCHIQRPLELCWLEAQTWTSFTAYPYFSHDDSPGSLVLVGWYCPHPGCQPLRKLPVESALAGAQQFSLILLRRGWSFGTA